MLLIFWVVVVVWWWWWCGGVVVIMSGLEIEPHPHPIAPRLYIDTPPLQRALSLEKSVEILRGV